MKSIKRKYQCLYLLPKEENEEIVLKESYLLINSDKLCLTMCMCQFGLNAQTAHTRTVRSKAN